MTEEELLKGLEGLTPPEEQPEEERVKIHRCNAAKPRPGTLGPLSSVYAARVVAVKKRHDILAIDGLPRRRPPAG